MSVHEAFSKKDISTTAVSSSVTAPRCSRAWILGGVPWVRDDGLSRKGLNRNGWLVDGSVNSVVVRKINSTLLSLERLSTGVLTHVRERRCNWQSSVPFCGIRSVPSVSVKDLLIRISHFWLDFVSRSERTGGSEGATDEELASLLQKFHVGYAAGDSCAGERGQVVPAVLADLSLPAVEPIPVESMSPRIAMLFEQWEKHMLVPESAKGATGPRARIRAYEDPLFATKKGKRDLAVMLYRANMLTFVHRRRGPPVRMFTVVKKVTESGQRVLRLIMDLRGTNAEFVQPPFCNLANVASLVYVDLSPSTIGNGELVGWGGDIPDFFYRLRIPLSMSEYFCLDGISALELTSALGIPPPANGEEHVALSIVAMGWSWAPYIAQCTAEDVIGSTPGLSGGSSDHFESFPVSDSRNFREYSFLQHGRITPQFYNSRGQPCALVQGILYVYIDDFGGWCIVRPGDASSAPVRSLELPDASGPRSPEEDLKACREKLQSVGLGCHKENLGLPQMLGFEVVKRPSALDSGVNEYVLRGEDKKFIPLVKVGHYILKLGECSPQTMSQWVGGMTWFALLNRGLLSVFQKVYAFIHVYWDLGRYKPWRLWESVRAEMTCILGLLPFCEISLSLEWGRWAYQVDAGPERTAILRSAAKPDELRRLGRLAERGGWLLHEEDGPAPSLAATIERALLNGPTREAVSRPREVDPEWFPKRRWKVLFNPPLRSKEHNTISEVRACVQAIRHYAASPRNWHTRLAIISDAFAAIGALSKGRSQSPAGNALCRQAAASIFIANLRVYLRWVASERNNADGPSRGLRFAGVDIGTAAKARIKAVGRALRKGANAFARATACSA